MEKVEGGMGKNTGRPKEEEKNTGQKKA